MSDSDATPTPPASNPEVGADASLPATTEPTKAQPAKPRGLDLSDLKIMPAWVANFGKEDSPAIREYRDDSDSSQRPRRGDRDSRPRSRFPDDRRGPPRGDKPSFGRPAGGAPCSRPDQGSSGPPRRDRRDDSGPRRGRDRDRDRRDAPQREWVETPKDITVSVHPDDKSLDALAAHVRSTGHAFSLFDIARLVLAGGERFGVRFLCAENRTQPLYLVRADGSLFLSRDEALQHILRSAALDTYYRAEEFEMEEPKGNFPSVAICGFSGEVLGPASHHSFQTSLIRLHRERFSNMSLEDYKRRVRNESDPELIQKWKDNQRKGLRWHPITPGSTPPAAAPTPAPEPAPIPEPVAETEQNPEPPTDVTTEAEPAAPAPTPVADGPPALQSRLEVEAHFRRHHADTAVKELRDVTVPGNIDKRKLSPGLFIMLRQSVDAARKHLFEMSQKLSAGFDRRGIKTFKRRSGKMFVSRVRPRAIDAQTVFAERVTAIVDLLKHAPGGLQLGDMLKTLVIDQAQTSETATEPTATADSVETSTQPAAEAAAAVSENETAVIPPESPAATASTTPLTDEQLAALKDVRWLVNEGYLIEYSDGLVTLGVQGETPAPKRAPAPSPAPKTSKPIAEAATAVEPLTEAPPEAESTDEAPTEAPPAAEITDEAPTEAAPEAAPEAEPQSADIPDEPAAEPAPPEPTPAEASTEDLPPTASDSQ
jgi:hypothetical protein